MCKLSVITFARFQNPLYFFNHQPPPGVKLQNAEKGTKRVKTIILRVKYRYNKSKTRQREREGEILDLKYKLLG